MNKLTRVLIFIGLVYVTVLVLTPGGDPAQAVKTAALDKSPEMQKKREAFISKAQKQGVISKIETPGSLPRVWVTPKFQAADFETKKSIASVVYAYYFEAAAPGNVVRIYDSRTGKEIGGFSEHGLEMN